MKHLHFFFLLLAIVFITNNNTFAQLDPVSLDDYYVVNCILPTTGNTIYAGTDGGVLRSIDNGVNYYTIGLEGIRIVDMAMGAIVNGIRSIFAVSGSVYKSTDNGSTWTTVLTGTGSNYAIKIDVVEDGPNNAIVFLTCRNDYPPYLYNWLYRSLENGTNFQYYSNPQLPVQAFHYTHSNGTSIFAGIKSDLTSTNGIYRSDNGGSSWEIMNYGFNPISPKGHLDPTVPPPPVQKIFSGNLPWDPPISLYESSYIDGNWEGWENISLTGFPLDNGITSIQPIYNGGQYLFAGTYEAGIYKKFESGNWEGIGVEYLFNVSRNVCLATNSTKRLLYGSDGCGLGYFDLPYNAGKSNDWFQSNIYDHPIPWINEIRRFATFYYCATRTGAFISIDGGKNWTGRNSGLLNTNINKLEIKGGLTFAATNGGVYKSENNGLIWVPSNSGIQDSIITSFALNSSYIFAGTKSKGVYTSSNNGGNWIITGLTNKKINSLFTFGNYIFAGTNSGVYSTTNNGNAWSMPSLTDTSIYSFTQSGSTIIAASKNTGIYTSSNNGLNWSSYNTGMTTSKVNDILAYGNVLYAATQDKGLFKDSVGVWRATNKNSGIFSKNITALEVGDSSKIFIGDNFGNIYYGPLSSIVNINKENNIIPEKYELSQNYPNPFNPTTKINFLIPKDCFASIKIYDILGKEVTTLVNQKLTPGIYSVDWNASQYPSGVYFYRLQSGDFVDVKKMLMIK